MLSVAIFRNGNEMGDMRESVSGALVRPPVPLEHLEALPLDWITSYL